MVGIVRSDPYRLAHCSDSLGKRSSTKSALPSSVHARAGSTAPSPGWHGTARSPPVADPAAQRLRRARTSRRRCRQALTGSGRAACGHAYHPARTGALPPGASAVLAVRGRGEPTCSPSFRGYSMVAALAGKRDQTQMGGHFPRIERKRLAVGRFSSLTPPLPWCAWPSSDHAGAFGTGSDERGGGFPRLGEALLTSRGSGYTKLSHRHATDPKYRMAPSSLLADELPCMLAATARQSSRQHPPGKAVHSIARRTSASPSPTRASHRGARSRNDWSAVSVSFFLCPGRRHSEIHVLAFALAMVDDAEQPALLVEQRPAFRTRRGTGAEELQQLAALAATRVPRSRLQSNQRRSRAHRKARKSVIQRGAVRPLALQPNSAHSHPSHKVTPVPIRA